MLNSFGSKIIAVIVLIILVLFGKVMWEWIKALED